ncbi:Protein TANC2 [Dissostichus eleginoides]|uniref:Protein TANC2 n=1 Tax=Dissostichus eleginoides TaxID=100907 RepID=A0AAD9B6K3_DISEL|nr:Protein TANC2 [Dissostichus eleginoides]KAK1877132.1 Protein TANC2 [Dissostichus eleginoides]
MFRNSLKMLLGGKPRKNHTGHGGSESEGSEVRMMEGFTRSLPSSPLLNLRLGKRTVVALILNGEDEQPHRNPAISTSC